MRKRRVRISRSFLIITLAGMLIAVSTRMHADSGSCDGQTVSLPFTDVGGSIFFCQIAEAYFSGLTSGTSATTYSPNTAVPRDQMAAFVTRTLDQALRRGSQRGTLNQWWTTKPQYDFGLGITVLDNGAGLLQSDGADLWVTNSVVGNVSRVRGSDGKLLETWMGLPNAWAPLVALGRIFVTGRINPGSLYMIDPSTTPEAPTVVSNDLGLNTEGIAFDGSRIWTANFGGSISIITPASTLPWPVSTITAGFNQPRGILYDGSNIWVTDYGDNRLKRVDADGAILQIIPVGGFPEHAIFDGTNIWVPNFGSASVTVVRASTGTVIATLTDNGLNFPQTASFDGERVLITNEQGKNVSLWRASSLSPLGSFVVGASPSFPTAACSDGLYFWIVLQNPGRLARF